MLEDGRYRPAQEIAEAGGITRSYVTRLLNLTLLAPDIITAILDGKQPKSMGLNDLTSGLPSDWQVQRERFSF